MSGPHALLMTVTVKYSCHVCGLVKAELEVAARGAEQDVVAWVEGLRPQLGADHLRRSPGCTAAAADLYIPLPAGAARIGDPTAH